MGRRGGLLWAAEVQGGEEVKGLFGLSVGEERGSLRREGWGVALWDWGEWSFLVFLFLFLG